MRLVRCLFLALISLSGLSGQIDLVFELSLKYESSVPNPVPPTLIEQRVLVQDQLLRIERAGFFVQVDAKAALVTLGDPRKRAYVEIAENKFQELKGNPLRADSANVPPMKRDDAAQAPSFRWLDRATTARVCSSAGPLVAAVPERGTVRNRLAVYSLPIGDVFGARVAGLEREQLRRLTQNQIGLQAAAFWRDCLGMEEVPLRLVLDSEVETSQKVGFRSHVEYLVKSLATVAIPRARFEVPAGWTKASESEAQAFLMAFAGVAMASEATPFKDPNRPLSKENLLSEIDALRKLVEEEKWEDGRKQASDIGYQFFLRIKEAQGPPPKQLEALEAKLAGPGASPYDAKEAARLAFELFDPIKIRKYSQLCLDLVTQQGSTDYSDLVHIAHTFLGILDWRDSNRASAVAHLAASGAIQGGPVTKSFGPRMELAKLLLEGGEKNQVLQYLENCKKFWSMEGGIPKLERWIGAIQTGAAPDFGFQATMYKVPER
jgi:hypothetical protein